MWLAAILLEWGQFADVRNHSFCPIYSACGGSLSPNGYTVALAQPMYGDLNSVSQYCGQTITIQANGKMHTATIEDACPTGRGNCGGADLDMSQALFNFFADPGAGKIGITWTFGDLVSQQAASSRSKAASIASKSKASSVSASKSKAAASKSSAALASKSAASLASAAAATGSAAAAQITSAAGYAAGSGAFGSLDEINAGFVKMANNAH